jgi:hypothetical protein
MSFVGFEFVTSDSERLEALETAMKNGNLVFDDS